MSTELKKFSSLLRRLVLRAGEGKLQWSEGAEFNTFSNSVANHTVLIGEKGQDYFLRVINSEGEIIDEFDDEYLKTSYRTVFNRSSYEDMRDLFQMARRNAQGSDKVIDEIIDELSETGDLLEDDLPF